MRAGGQIVTGLIGGFSQQLEKQIVDGFKDTPVSAWSQMEVVIHIQVRDSSIRQNKSGTLRIDQLNATQDGQFPAQQLVNPCVSLTKRIGQMSTRQQSLSYSNVLLLFHALKNTTSNPTTIWLMQIIIKGSHDFGGKSQQHTMTMTCA